MKTLKTLMICILLVGCNAEEDLSRVDHFKKSCGNFQNKFILLNIPEDYTDNIRLRIIKCREANAWRGNK